VITALLCFSAAGARAQQAPVSGPSEAVDTASVPDEFLIGPEDVLGIFFWRDKEMSGDVTVRPDGIITIPLLGEIRAAGLSSSALAREIQTKATTYISDPNVTVTVRQINSRKVYITGEVNSPGAYPLVGPMTVLQLIALAGGVLEYARIDSITVLREEQGLTRAIRFNYNDVSRGQRLEQNILLQPGDTVVIP
jgi:polysaccharide export outer membrane protein